MARRPRPAVAIRARSGLWVVAVSRVFGADGVAKDRGGGVDAEPPDAEVEVAVVEDFDKGELADIERADGGEAEPVAALERLGAHGGDVFRERVAVVGWEQGEGEEDAGVNANIGADDDVATGGGAARVGGGGLGGVAVGIDGKSGAGGGGVGIVADADVEDGIGDVELGGGAGAAQGIEGVWAGERVDGGGQDVVRGVGVEWAAGGALVLGEREEHGAVADGVEGEDGVKLGQAEVGGNLWGEGGAGGLLGEELGIDGGRLAGLRGGLAEGPGVALLPFLGGVEVDEGDGDELFRAGTFGGVIDDVAAGDVIVGDELKAAVSQNEVDAVAGLVGRGEGGGVLGDGQGGGEERAESKAREGGRKFRAGCEPFLGLVRLPYHRMLSAVPV